MRFLISSITVLTLILFISCESEEKPSVPGVSPSVVMEIMPTSAVVSATALTEGGSPITEKGIVWDTHIQPTISLSTKTNEGGGLGSFLSNISNLQVGTQYFVRAYAINSFGIAYGKEATFTTPTDLPTITVTSVKDKTYTTSLVESNLSNDGGSPVTIRGVVWSTEPHPTTSLSTKLTAGSGNGPFTSMLAGLSKATKYYVRAFASNANGTAYSGEVTFTTASMVKLQEIKFGTITHSFEYDATFKLRKRNITVSTVANFIDSLVIEYSSGKAVVKEYDTESGLYLMEEHTLNNEGYSTSYNRTLFNPNNFVLEYETGSLLKSIKTNTQLWYTFSYQQGNLQTFKYEIGFSHNYILEYHQDKMNSLEFGYGMDDDYYNSGFYLNHHPLLGKPIKNLIKKTAFLFGPPANSNDVATREFSYEFDQDGDVKTATRTSKKADGTVVSTLIISYKKYYF